MVANIKRWWFLESGVGQNVPSMTVKYGVGLVSLRTVERRRHWQVQGVGEQEQKLP